MPVRVELYLRNRVIRGELATDGVRTLDRFNRHDPAITLQDAQVASFHVAVRPRALGTVRVDKSQVLLVVPDDTDEQMTLRGAWVPKKRVQAEAGVGPLDVRGTFHLGSSPKSSLEQLLFGDEERIYIPVTNALVTCEYHQGWSAALPTVFLMRRVVEFITSPQPVAEHRSELVLAVAQASPVNGRNGH